MQIIAEVKTHSPFGWESSKTWDELLAIADKIGDIISIHTEEPWHGSLKLIQKARSLTCKPILAKGIHKSDASIRQALDAGADYVLVVGRMPGVHIERCLIEPLSLEQLGHLPNEVKAVWNSRDLSNGKKKSETFAEAREIFGGWLCQASNIECLADIAGSANAVLIGTHLPEIAAELGL